LPHSPLSPLFGTIEMPEPTSLLVFVVLCAKKSNVPSQKFHKVIDANIGYGIKGPYTFSIFILTFHVIIAVTFPL
jgi:hypothetical protein